MNKKRFIAKLIALFGITFFMLNACGKAPSLPPDQVINNFKNAVKSVKSADMSITARMKGVDNSDNIDFSLNSDIKVDRMEEKRNADLSLKVEGSLDAGGQNLDGNLDARIQIIGDEFYFNLAKFDSTDPNTEKIEKALQPYMGKWEHLSSDFIPQNIKDLQKSDPETQKKEEQLKELFVNSKMFEVSKEYGIEKLSGNDVYHFGIKLNKDEVKDYIKKAAAINGEEKTDAEVDESATFVDSISDLQMWIGAEDFFLYKGTVTLSGANTEASSSSSIAITFTAKSYNKDLSIKKPEGAEEFNPISLLMGLQLDPGATDATATVPAEGADAGAQVTIPADTDAAEGVVTEDKTVETDKSADTEKTETPSVK